MLIIIFGNTSAFDNPTQKNLCSEMWEWIKSRVGRDVSLLIVPPTGNKCVTEAGIPGFLVDNGSFREKWAGLASHGGATVTTHSCVLKQ